MSEQTTVQNVIFPSDRDPDVLPLYLDAETWTTIDDRPVRVSSATHIDAVLSRSGARVPAGRRFSFASYFNAFPAAYWQHWTNVRRVTLELATEGAGTVLVYRSNAQGVPQRMSSHTVEGEETTVVELPVTGFGDGGWYWFDIEANSEPVTLRSGAWSVAEAPVRDGRASLAITTYNKPDYCVATLDALAGAEAALGVVDRIFVVDQGTRHVVDEPGYGQAAERLGERLVMITQPNLGGSGGFSRGMAETLEREESDFVLLLDDDVTLEPESILRAVQFGRHARKPTLVGGHMFDLLNRPVLHAWAEIVDRDPFVWRPAHADLVPHDFRTTNLRQTAWMHSRMDADYTGWWFCLIPTETIRTVGLSLPAFIKWDDAEYCLRARDAGFPTVTLPGAALWHVSWLDKDDTLDWQAYFHARNRTVAALLHSPHKHGGLFPRDSRRWDLKHLLSMQYYPIALRHRALRDVLSGPEHMHAGIGSVLGELNRTAKAFPEKRVLKTDEELPTTNRGKQVFPLPTGTGKPRGPRGIPLVLYTAKATARHWLTKPSADNLEQPEVELAQRDATWFRTPGFDSALVSTADGTGKNWYTRDPKAFRRMLKESIRLHRELEKNWEGLSRRYREALGEITSVEAWRKTFGPGSGK